MLVTFEVLLECLIPYVIAILVDEIQGGCTLETILIYGAILIVMGHGFAGVRRMFGRGVRVGFERAGKEFEEGYVL